MHVPSDTHWNILGGHCSFESTQFSSSLPSPQSFSPSHRYMLGIHNFLAHVKKPGAHVFDICGHVLLAYGAIEPGHRHSPFADIDISSGHKHVNLFCGAPTQMYVQLFGLEHALEPVCRE